MGELGRQAGVEVVPVDDERRLSGLHRGGRGVDREEVPGVVELREEVDALGEVTGGATLRDRGHLDARERGACLGRVAVEGDLALVVGLEEVGDRRRGGHLRRVVADAHVAAVVVDPRPVGVLEVGGDVVPGRHLVGREHVGVREGDRGAEVEDVGCSALALEPLRGRDLVGAARVGLVARHGDVRVLRLEALDDLAVVRPVRRQGDDVERAFRLRGGDEAVHATERLGGGGRLRVDGAGPRPGGRRGVLVAGRGAGRDAHRGEARHGEGACATCEGCCHVLTSGFGAARAAGGSMEPFAHSRDRRGRAQRGSDRWAARNQIVTERGVWNGETVVNWADAGRDERGPTRGFAGQPLTYRARRSSQSRCSRRGQSWDQGTTGSEQSATGACCSSLATPEPLSSLLTTSHDVNRCSTSGPWYPTSTAVRVSVGRTRQGAEVVVAAVWPGEPQRGPNRSTAPASP